VEKEDGSLMSTVTAPDGTKTEVRRFNSGDVSRVVRTTSPSGKRTATVEFRDGRKAELNDDSDIERAMDATAATVKTAALKTWDVTKTVGSEAADKTEDAADKTVGVSKKVGSAAKKGATEAADKAEDVGDQTVKGAKKVGREAKKLGKKIKDKVN
jgi:hypothetical protein